MRADAECAAVKGHHLTKHHLTTAGFSLAVLAALCLSPSLLGDRVSEAVIGLDAADPAFWRRGLDVISGFIDELERAG